MTPKSALTKEERSRRDRLAGSIRTRLRWLITEKADREGKTISLRQIGRETGIDVSTLSAWVNNKVTRFDAYNIAALCEYFSTPDRAIGVGDLIEHTPSDSEPANNGKAKSKLS